MNDRVKMQLGWYHLLVAVYASNSLTALAEEFTASEGNIYKFLEYRSSASCC